MSLLVSQLHGFNVAGFGGSSATYTSGTAATETVPSGATSVRIRVYGGGGAGGRDSTDTVQTGGGGGGFCEKTCACAGGDTMTYTVGALSAGRATNGDGADGNNSTVTGTLTGTGAISLAGNGGQGGAGFGGSKTGAGGTASGGDTNTTGGNGVTPSGGSCLGTGGGAGGSGPNDDGNPPGGGGAGCSTGTSGDGARGQIEFVYT